MVGHIQRGARLKPDSLRGILRLCLLLAGLLILACASTDAPTPPPSEFTPTSEPEIIELGPRLQRIDPNLGGLIFQHAAGKELPEGVAIRIGVYPDIETDLTLDDWLEKIDFWETEDALCVPTQYLAALAQRPDILAIEEAYGPSDSGLGGGLESKTVCDPRKEGASSPSVR